MPATTLGAKQRAAVIWFCNAVSSEAPTTANHEERLKIARALLSGSGGAWTYFVEDCDLVSEYTDATPQNDVNNRLSGLATNMIALGLV